MVKLFHHDNDTNNIRAIYDQPILNRDIFIANIASSAAIGHQDKIESSIMKFLQNNSSNINDVRNILIHQIIYCGFPVAVNSFAALKSVIEKIKP